MKIYIIKKGNYYDDYIVNVVFEKDFQSYIEDRLVVDKSEFDEWFKKLNISHGVKKTISADRFHECNSDKIGGSFGYKAEVLAGKEEITKFTFITSLHYEVMEIWKNPHE
jgi:hypothetical protein